VLLNFEAQPCAPVANAFANQGFVQRLEHFF